MHAVCARVVVHVHRKLRVLGPVWLCVGVVSMMRGKAQDAPET